MLLFAWLGVSTVMSDDVRDHFKQFKLSIGVSGKTSRVANLIRIGAVVVIWNKRNNLIFRGVAVDQEQAVNLTQQKVWLWLKVRNRHFSYSAYA